LTIVRVRNRSFDGYKMFRIALAGWLRAAVVS